MIVANREQYPSADKSEPNELVKEVFSTVLSLISRFHLIKLVKVAQINYVSRNQLHCTQIFILALCRKRQNIAGLCQQTFYFCSADSFSSSYFASC